jgi:hypothetical protein
MDITGQINEVDDLLAGQIGSEEALAADLYAVPGTSGGTVADEQIAAAVEAYLAEHPAVRVAEVELISANWVGDTSPYYQIVNILGVTQYTQVDLTPSVEQLLVFHEKDLTFVTENEGGVVTVFAIGQKPENDYVIQVTMKEVSV